LSWKDDAVALHEQEAVADASLEAMESEVDDADEDTLADAVLATSIEAVAVVSMIG
jgi:hypothetical protein